MVLVQLQSTKATRGGWATELSSCASSGKIAKRLTYKRDAIQCELKGYLIRI
jgi:hypothetical protein